MKRRPKINIQGGEVFSIPVENGFGFLQFVETDQLGIEYVRVLSPVNSTQAITQEQVDNKERWSVGFPLIPAYKKGIVDYIGKFQIPLAYNPGTLTRSIHNVRGEHLGWRIIDRKNLKAEFKEKLSESDIKLSPHGVFNDTLIVDYLNKNWTLEDWK